LGIDSAEWRWAGSSSGPDPFDLDDYDDEETASGYLISLQEQAKRQMDSYSPNELHNTDNSWKILFEWNAVQPQRIRMIKPLFFALARSSCRVDIRARIYADTVPAPFSLTACLDIKVTEKQVSVQDVLPRLSEIIDEMSRRDTRLSSRR